MIESRNAFLHFFSDVQSYAKEKRPLIQMKDKTIFQNFEETLIEAYAYLKTFMLNIENSVLFIEAKTSILLGETRYPENKKYLYL